MNVTAGAGCAWTAVANASWIHVTSGASGSGNGTVGYRVDANTSTSTRSGTMTIAGQTFTVTQARACTYSISPTKATVPKEGVASASVAITAPSGCPWTAVSNASWVHVIGPASGSGNATVTYSADPQPTKAKKRNGKMIIAGRTFTVTQNR